MAGTVIEAKVAVEAIHAWPDAPDEVPFLRVPHRHVFVIRARKAVQHDDRDIEFIQFGWRVKHLLGQCFPRTGTSMLGYPEAPLDLGVTSCEQLARMLLDHFGLDSCSVHEDDENGATVSAETPPR
jgi:hypothetical protein